MGIADTFTWTSVLDNVELLTGSAIVLAGGAALIAVKFGPRVWRAMVRMVTAA